MRNPTLYKIHLNYIRIHPTFIRLYHYLYLIKYNFILIIYNFIKTLENKGINTKDILIGIFAIVSLGDILKNN